MSKMREKVREYQPGSFSPIIAICRATEVRQLEAEHNELLGKTEELERKLKIAEEALKQIEKALIVSSIEDDEAIEIIAIKDKALKQIKRES